MWRYHVLYEWSVDEEGSGDTSFRFGPQDDDRQAIVIENLPMPLNEFFEDYYQEFADARLTGDWVAVYRGNAYWIKVRLLLC